ncbi:MAG: hypothetical protein KatS3mg050_1833 [Litorilinea sp.]|nr:MAG: hypothetical protein KatS3mg050_1833 [Litorilinea sp.]
MDKVVNRPLPRAVRGRPRGFIEWRPRGETWALLGAVNSILQEYREHLPLTLRQIFYRLVAVHGYEKTERGYQRLCEVLNKARRARLIEFDAIRDDGFVEYRGWWSDPDAFVAALRREVEGYQMDRQADQPWRVVVWCEAAGMAPQLRSVCKRYSVPVYSSGGFDSLTTKERLARRFAEMGRVVVLHIGDHDPSGVHVFGSLDEDVRAFLEWYGGDAEFVRLAVLPEHVDIYGLPTAPPKRTDRRNFRGETVQAEALPPDILADLVRTGIERHLDMWLYRAALEEEARQRRWLMDWLDGRAPRGSG